MLHKVHDELLNKVKEKKSRYQMLLQLHKELLTSIQVKMVHRQCLQKVHKELLTRLQEKEKVKQIVKTIHKELLSRHAKKESEREHFVPRKLLLFNIVTFKTLSKSDLKVEEKEMEHCQLKDVSDSRIKADVKESNVLPQNIESTTSPRTQKARKGKMPLKDRLKRFLGLK
ncbi:uncharacterized protein LOC133190826 [Saccostrea echinata]|uniref:uncharacterized protein LOC133190826 n=1 Tax=Saccostrea echinata TaxID=191078 RepID=UPI002A7F2C3C|nr:uncharacterized protein LOC133190826 [Saccostrea echinata]